MRLFIGKVFPLLYSFLAPDIAAEGTISNVFSYDAVSAEIRTYHLPVDERIRYVMNKDVLLLQGTLTLWVFPDP